MKIHEKYIDDKTELSDRLNMGSQISLYIEWFIVALFFIAIIYTMFVIKKEKAVFLEDPQKIQLGNFILSIPKWWSVLNKDSNSINFHRSDTRYDWQANFKIIEHSDETSLKEQLGTFIKEKEIVFDDQNNILDTDKLFTEYELSNKSFHFLRVEGTATEKGVERIYYDAYLTSSNDKKMSLFMESKSSVLNGLVEGPYFEEVVKRIDLN